MLDQTEIKENNENEDMVKESARNFEVEENNNVETIIGNQVQKETHVNEQSGKKPNFFASLGAVISDAVIIGVISFAVLYIVDFILRNTAGYYITEKFQMMFIIYVAVSLLYVSIMEAVLGFTVGKNVLGIKTSRA